MAFVKYARARIIKPDLEGQAGWSRVRTAAKKADVAPDLIRQASDILGMPFNPEDYLLTHCTIVSSVNVEPVPGIKVGRIKEGNRVINRLYGDYRVTEDTLSQINSNFDCWSRGVILKSYKTFIGGVNYLEHVQITELEKGRILDAVIRDVGNSVYVDILVATDRKHTQLIEDIQSGNLTTLSMGCLTDSCSCTKCGNVAYDDTDLCDCIKYEKGNIFYYSDGKKGIVAELCGNASIDPTGGNQFIEASWVGKPAFGGAVMRNIIEPENMPEAIRRKAQEVLSSLPKEWTSAGRVQKAAYLKTAGPDDFPGGGGDEDAGGDAPAEDTAPKPSLKELEDSMVQKLLQNVRQRLTEELKLDGTDAPPDTPESEMAPNDSIVKQAKVAAYNNSLRAMLRTASSDADLLNKVAAFNQVSGIEIPVPLYRVALRLGSCDRHGSLNAYLASSEKVLGRKVSAGEAKTLVRLGKLLEQFSKNKNRN